MPRGQEPVDAVATRVMSNFYDWRSRRRGNAGTGTTAAVETADGIDGKTAVRRHPDGSVCTAKSEASCPVLHALRLVDDIDRLDPKEEDSLGSGAELVERLEALPPSPEETLRRECAEVVARYTNHDGTKKPGWMRAPNGSPSNLDEQLWTLVRTPSFKERFEDWERLSRKKLLEAAVATNVEVGAFQRRNGEKPLAAAIKICSTPVVYNTEIGNVTIDGRSARASLAHNFSKKKLDTIVTLQRDFANAVYIGSEKDFDGKPLLNHYFAYPIIYDGKRNLVFCRAREDANANRLYVHEVFVEEDLRTKTTFHKSAKGSERAGDRKDGDALQAAAAFSRKDAGHTDASPNARLRGRALAFSILKNLISDSPSDAPKYLDENGEPRIAYR